MNWFPLTIQLILLQPPQFTEEISELVKSELLILEPEKSALYSFVLRKEVPNRAVMNNANFLSTGNPGAPLKARLLIHRQLP